jgi:hypothetical protein
MRQDTASSLIDGSGEFASKSDVIASSTRPPADEGCGCMLGTISRILGAREERGNVSRRRLTMRARILRGCERVNREGAASQTGRCERLADGRSKCCFFRTAFPGCSTTGYITRAVTTAKISGQSIRLFALRVHSNPLVSTSQPWCES